MLCRIKLSGDHSETIDSDCVTLHGCIKSATMHFISYKVPASGTAYTNRKLLNFSAFHGDTNYIIMPNTVHIRYKALALRVLCALGPCAYIVYVPCRHDLCNTYLSEVEKRDYAHCASMLF